MSYPSNTADWVLATLESWVAAGHSPSPEELLRLTTWAGVARSELRSLVHERHAAREILLDGREVVTAIAPDVGRHFLSLAAEHEALGEVLDQLIRTNVYSAEDGKPAPIDSASTREAESPEQGLRDLAVRVGRPVSHASTPEKTLPSNVTKFRKR